MKLLRKSGSRRKGEEGRGGGGGEEGRRGSFLDINLCMCVRLEGGVEGGGGQQTYKHSGKY